MCVRDVAAAVRWHEVFFGRAADHVIGEEYLWQVGENAYVVLDDRGCGLCGSVGRWSRSG